MTTITLSVVEAQAFAATPVGETFWLVREGVDWVTSPFAIEQLPPPEFVQACAFCTACDARLWDRGHNRKTDCPDCRIELVGLMDGLACGRTRRSERHLAHVWNVQCEDDSPHREDVFCSGYGDGTNYKWPTVTLGHAYAEGQPLPIAWEDDFSPEWQVSHNPIVIVTNERRPVTMPWPKVLAWHDPDAEPVGIDMTAAVAHCGPPETLVGQWAIALRRVQP